MTFLDPANRGAVAVNPLKSNFAYHGESQECIDAQIEASGGKDALAEEKFRREHGMSRKDYERRERLMTQERLEAAALAGLDGEPPAIEVPAGLSDKRKAYAAYVAWLRAEEARLADLESRRRDLQILIDAQVELESNFRALVRRAADRLWRGLPKDESDIRQHRELTARQSDQRLQAAAATVALEDLAPAIATAEARVARLRERENEFLVPCVREAAAPMLRLLARKRAEVEVLERMTSGLSLYVRYGLSDDVEAPRIAEPKWSGWHAVANTLRADPLTDVTTTMLPNLSGIT